MNSDDQPKQNNWLTKRLLKFIAFGSIFMGVGCIIVSIKFYIEDTFLKTGATIDPNPKVIEGMIGMIKDGCFGIIPALSVLLFINSLLLLACCRKFYSKADK